MTPKIIELKQAPVVLVEFPEGTNPYSEITRKEMHSIDIPTSSLIGVLSDLNEDQFAECVPKEMYSHLKDQEAIWYEAIFIMDILQSENVYTENPYGEKPEPCGCMGSCGIPCAFNEWQEAQSRTINPERTVVLVRKEGK